jgi:hypothetical protein
MKSAGLSFLIIGLLLMVGTAFFAGRSYRGVGIVW